MVIFSRKHWKETKPGKEYLLKAFAADALPKDVTIEKLSPLGSDVEVSWKKEEQGLWIKVPECRTDEMAVVFKIEPK